MLWRALLPSPDAKLQHLRGCCVCLVCLQPLGVRCCTLFVNLRLRVCVFLCIFAIAMIKDNILNLSHEYGRTELACIYCPRLTPQAAWRKLRMWISINSELSLELTALGYDGHHRSFTPRMVQAIAHYLGEP